MENVVKVGVGLYLLNKNRQLLLGLRKSKHGEGTWCPPGGHLEYGESFEQAAARETREETGLIVDEKNISVAGVTNDFFETSGKHYITIHLFSGFFEGNPLVLEPDKCAQWRWFNLDELPSEMFLPARHFLEKYDLVRLQKTC